MRTRVMMDEKEQTRRRIWVSAGAWWLQVHERDGVTTQLYRRVIRVTGAEHLADNPKLCRAWWDREARTPEGVLVQAVATSVSAESLLRARHRYVPTNALLVPGESAEASERETTRPPPPPAPPGDLLKLSEDIELLMGVLPRLDALEITLANVADRLASLSSTRLAQDQYESLKTDLIGALTNNLRGPVKQAVDAAVQKAAGHVALNDVAKG